MRCTRVFKDVMALSVTGVLLNFVAYQETQAQGKDGHGPGRRSGVVGQPTLILIQVFLAPKWG